MQINRLLEMVYILMHRKSMSARELAEQLGVSRRTIYRDIDTLSGAGIPIYTEMGKGGGVSLLPDSVLNKSILSEQEQNEILIALHGLSNVKVAETDRVLHKLQAIFNKTATDWLKVDFSDWHCDNDFWGDLKIAIIERRIAEFDYYNSNGDKRFRRVEPIQLWFKSKSWYLKGFCLTKQNIRVYKLSRIKNLVVTDEYFSERDSIVASGNSAIDSNEELQWITLKLRIEPEAAYQVYDDFTQSEIEKQPDGSFVIIATMPETQGLCGFLLSYRKYVEVLEPEHIRTMIKTEAEKISKKHS